MCSEEAMVYVRYVKSVDLPEQHRLSAQYIIFASFRSWLLTFAVEDKCHPSVSGTMLLKEVLVFLSHNRSSFPFL